MIKVSESCPSCSSTEYRKVRPERFIAYVYDRVCLNCNTRYSPPTPKWASIVFMTGGILLLGVCVFVLAGTVVGENTWSFAVIRNRIRDSWWFGDLAWFGCLYWATLKGVAKHIPSKVRRRCEPQAWALTGRGACMRRP